MNTQSRLDKAGRWAVFISRKIKTIINRINILEERLNRLENCNSGDYDDETFEKMRRSDRDWDKIEDGDKIPF